MTASYFRSSTYNRLCVCSKAFATMKLRLRVFGLCVILYERYDVSGYPFYPNHRLDKTRISCYIKPEHGLERISRNLSKFRSHRLCVSVMHLNIIYVKETTPNRRKLRCGHPYNKVKTFQGIPLCMNSKLKQNVLKVNVKNKNSHNKILIFKRCC